MAQTKQARSEAAKKAAATRKRNARKAERARNEEPALAETPEQEQELVEDKQVNRVKEHAEDKDIGKDEDVKATKERKKAGHEADDDRRTVDKFENNNPEVGGDAEHPEADERMVDAARAQDTSGETDARTLSGDRITRQSTRGGKSRKEPKRAERRASHKKVTRKAAKGDVSQEVAVGGRFSPGTEVLVYRSVDVELERGRNREPVQNPLSSAKVGKDGTLEISVPKKGQYSLAGNVGTDKEPSWRYLSVAVK